MEFHKKIYFFVHPSFDPVDNLEAIWVRPVYPKSKHFWCGICIAKEIHFRCGICIVGGNKHFRCGMYIAGENNGMCIAGGNKILQVRNVSSQEELITSGAECIIAGGNNNFRCGMYHRRRN